MPAPSPVSGVGSGRAAVLEPLERLERAVDHLVRRGGVESRDEGDAARVVLVRRVIEPLRLHSRSLPLP